MPRVPLSFVLSSSDRAAAPRRLCALLLALGATLALVPKVQAAPAMQAFESEQALQEGFQAWRERVLATQRARRAALSQGAGSNLMLSMAGAQQGGPAAAAPTTKMAADAMPSAAPPGTPEAEAAADGITNVQTAGVDEGGIVKRAGDHLVILRRGRLFTVRVGGDALAPVAMVDAFAPGTDPRGAWYDELLVSGSTVVVIGYSYQREGTEIGLFELGRDGSLRHQATWHLRSGDYYSSRNSTSRLLGNQLIFYTPLALNPAQPSWPTPGVRRWRPSLPGGFKTLLPATRIYRSDDVWEGDEALMLHTVTRCEIQGAELSCQSSAVLGPPGRVFYVSGGSVYVWTTRHRGWGVPGAARSDERAASAVFRLPLNGATPTALKTTGAPVDMLSFLEDADGHLNVLLGSDGNGEGMWGAEQARGRAMALLRVPLTAFGDGSQAATRAHYRRLPPAPPGPLHNRYVGSWLLWGGAGGRQAYALPLNSDRGPVVLNPGHGIERIEALGGHAVLVGQRQQDLVFTAARLSARDARLAGRFVQSEARSSESRSHGFFYRPTGEEEGLLGLPIVGSGEPAPEGEPSATLRRPRAQAGVVFLRHRQLDFAPLGTLDASEGRPADDRCRASCVDWYGQSRPIFLGERVFALLGYELVEGQLSGSQRDGREALVERRRIDFGPKLAARDRYSPFQ